MSMRASAIQSWMLALSADRLAEGDPGLRPLAHQLQRPLGHADGPHAVVDTAGTEPGLADREALTLALEHVLGGHPHVVEVDLGVALAVLVAEHRQAAQHGDAGGVDRARPSSTAAGAAAAAGSVLPITIMTLQFLCRALEANHFRPLRTYSSPSRTMDSSTLVASELATCGSVIANAEADGAVQQRLEVLLLVLVGAEQRQHLHVAGVGGVAVARLGGE